MAAAFFNQLAPAGKRATAAGQEPQETLGTNAIRLLTGTVAGAFLDRELPRPLSAVATAALIVAIDPIAMQVVGRYALPGCRHPHGLALDAALRLAFVACDENATLPVIDLGTMHVTARHAVGDQPDVLTFDEGLYRSYVAAESGTATIFEERGTALTRVAEGLLASRAHTVAVDPQTHRVSFPLENSHGHAALQIFEPVLCAVPASRATP